MLVRTMRRAAVLVATVIAVSAGLTISPSPAAAHGALLIPGSRTYLCYLDGLRENGQIIAYNPACADAIEQSTETPLYNWFAVLDSAAAGRTVGYVPDGTICSAGNRSPYDFSPYNMARDDWPKTHLTSGGSIEVRHNNWAAHPGRFDLYITKDGWDPAAPLAWSDLEPEPFFSITGPPQSGAPGGFNYYQLGQVQLPGGKTGNHIIVSHWIRSDSPENFFGCSDVVFDGGNGEVTGVGPNQGGGGAAPAKPAASAPEAPARPTTSAPEAPSPVLARPSGGGGASW
jgi:predicted carbohydrate-binding protein with CBM5 and CBM33 domain